MLLNFKLKISECEIAKVRGKNLKVPLFAERKVCLEKELHIWIQHYISYKKVPISITFEKVVEVLYFGNLKLTEKINRKNRQNLVN
jgi:hypothetical protein